MTTTNFKATNARILRYLQSGRDLTTAQAQQRFGITNVSARISELRKAGFAIYLNTKTTANGRTIRAYRLGAPTRRVVAAGMLVTRDGFLTSQLGEEIDQNLSLVE